MGVVETEDGCAVRHAPTAVPPFTSTRAVVYPRRSLQGDNPVTTQAFEDNVEKSYTQ